MTTISDHDVRTFAEAWFAALDRHDPPEVIVTFIDPDDLHMTLPDKTLHGVDDFVAWYAGGTYRDGEATPGVINAFFDELHSLVGCAPISTERHASVDVLVAWQASTFVAPEARSRRLALDASQRWQLRVDHEARNPLPSSSCPCIRRACMPSAHSTSVPEPTSRRT